MQKTLLTLALAATMPALAATRLAATNLEDLSLEQLTEVRVTSVSKREERLVDAPASIYVISAEDIRRSGATDLYAVLRLAPNLYVGRGDSNQWVAAARGQISGTSNKMLVLIDGRTVYTPLFSGVFSDSQYVMVEDIERVEVISGPAATLWGSNGVNGVINVITKSARDTQGTLASAWGGNYERGVDVRQGGTLGADGNFRIYAKYRKTDDRELLSGSSAMDASERILAGFRGDWDRANGATTVEAEAYKGDIGNLGGDRDVKGGHVLGRWTGETAGGGKLRVQAYYDRSERVHAGSFGEKLDLVDLEVQDGWSPRADHNLVVGAGYRYGHDQTDSTQALAFDPADTSQSWANAFVQDEWSITRSLRLTGGLKAEHNPYTGLEWLPNLRFATDVAPNHLVWGEVSRSIRVPSRIDRDAFTGPLHANDTFEAERAEVVELGYRAQVTSSASFSLTAFHHHYPNLRSVEFTPDMTGVMYANGFEGRETGIEGWGSWRVTSWWRLEAGFTTMTETIRARPGHTDLVGVGLISNDPRHTAQLRSHWDIGSAWELDVAVRNAGHIPNFDVPAYTVADTRIAWHASRALEISLAVDNVFDRRYTELGPASQRAVFDRSWYLLFRWQT